MGRECFDFSNRGIIGGGMYTQYCGVFFSDHDITRGGVYPGYKLPFKIDIQTKKKENQQTPHFLLVSEFLIQM